MDSARIAALLAPYLPETRRLTSGELSQLSKYLDLLLRWNVRINLTAVREPEQIVTRHFGESLFAAEQLFHRPSPVANSQLLDLGSGAGFPGLPIKIWVPQLSVTLIESRQRKATFLREVIRALALTNVTVFCGRAEDFPGPPADVVTLRAVERFEDVLPTAARLVASGGRLALLIGSAQVPRARELESGLNWGNPTPIPQSTASVLLVATKPERHESNQ